MATWNFYAWTSGEDTAPASGLEINGASSALSFGGGSRSDFQTNITLGSWNSALHYAKDTAESSVDYCVSPHLHPIYPTNTFDSGSVVDGAYINMSDGSPDPARGIGLKFTHTFGVKVYPINIWAGTSPGIGTGPQSCEVAICDLSTGQSPSWSTVSVASALALKAHNLTNDEAEEHWWSVGIAVKPTVVGHNGENVIRVEATYY